MKLKFTSHWMAAFTLSICGLTACDNPTQQSTTTYNPVSIEEMGLQMITPQQGFQTTGIGNQDHILMRIVLNRDIENPALPLSGLSFTLSENTKNNNLTHFHVYATETPFLNGDKKQFARLLGSLQVSPNKTDYSIFFNKYIPLAKENYLWITTDISSKAIAGDTIDIKLNNIYGDNNVYSIEKNANPQGVTVIYEKQKMLFNPWDAGSEFYRIPALITLESNKDNHKGRLLSVTDRRFQYNWDLPNHIDLVARISDDNGSNWSHPQTIAGYYKDSINNQGPDYGYGDAALVETANGKIICMMAADHQYQASTYETPIRMYFTSSNDGGDTWEKPKEITSSLYESIYEGAPSKLQGMFVTSGKGLCLSHQTGANAKLNGRILFSMVCKFLSGPYQNYIIYSDDEGKTWQISATTAYVGGDEAKLVEEADGTVILSTRRYGERGFNISKDGGSTWGEQTTNPAIWGTSCNADMLIYSENLYIHTILNAQDRRNLTIYASTDKGKTWPYKRVINELPAAYSTIVKCADGKLGIYYEDGTMSGHY